MTIQPLIIDSELSDDWMKLLPGYKDEVAIHDALEKKHLEREEKGSEKSGD